MDKDFQFWMNSQMCKYRASEIPFIGYTWYTRRGEFGGGALYRLDTVTVQNTRNSHLKDKKDRRGGALVEAGTKLKANKTGIQAVMSVIRKLEREGKQVYTYSG